MKTRQKGRGKETKTCTRIQTERHVRKEEDKGRERERGERGVGRTEGERSGDREEKWGKE